MNIKNKMFIFAETMVMRKCLFLLAVLVLTLGVVSCQKNTYCQCFAINDDNEDISLGEDVDIESMTEETLLTLIQNDNFKENVYVIEEGTCSDKAKEITGWGQVTCKEVDPKDPEGTWYERIFNKLFGGGNNNNNNNNGNNNDNSGKP